MNVLGIFIFYNKRKEINNYVKYLIKEIKKDVKDLIVVCNGEITSESKRYFQENATHLYMRDNAGFDAGAYQDVILNKVGIAKVREYDELLLFNNSFYGPIYSFSDMFKEMRLKKLDFWGITAGGNNLKGNTPFHIQSYFLVISRSILQDDCFEEYWKTQEKCNIFHDAVQNFELRFTNYFLKQGYICGTYIDLEEIKKDYYETGNFLNRLNYEVISDWKCPVLKRKYIMSTETEALHQNNADVLSYIKEYTDYNIDLIWDDLIKEYTPYEINAYRYLRYIISPKFDEKSKEDKVLIAIYSEHYLDYINYIRQSASNVEVVIIVDDENRASSENSDFYSYLFKGESDIFDILGNLILHYGCTEVCILADSLKNESRIKIQRYVEDVCNKLLYSDQYIMQIKKLFNDNKYLGLLLPDVFCQFDYWKRIGENDRLTRKKIEMLHSLQYNYETIEGEKILVNSGCFWCKASVLSAIFSKRINHKFEIEDIFSVLPYFVKNEGYFTGIINNAETMQKEYTLKCEMLYSVFEKINNNFVYGNIAQAFANLSRGGIMEFLYKYKKIYIYGAGKFGERCYNFLSDKDATFLGFIVSESADNQKFMNFKVWNINEIKLKRDEAIIVAMNKKNQQEVVDKLKRYPDEQIYYV